MKPNETTDTQVYENKRKELIQSMDVSGSEIMFPIHSKMSSDWAEVLAGQIDILAEEGNDGVARFVAVSLELSAFIDQKEKYFRDNYGSYESASASSPTFMGSMLRSFGKAENPQEFEVQGVKDSKTQNDYENAFNMVNQGYKAGSVDISVEGVSVVFRGLRVPVGEAVDPEMPFAPNLVELPVIDGKEFAEQKAPAEAMKSQAAIKTWMEGQLQTNPVATTNAVRGYVEEQNKSGKSLSKEEVMADEQHVAAAKELYLSQSAAVVKTKDLPSPVKTEEGASVYIDDEEASQVSFYGGGKYELTMRNGGKVSAQIFREIEDMDEPSKAVFSRFEKEYGEGSSRNLGFSLGKG